MRLALPVVVGMLLLAPFARGEEPKRPPRAAEVVAAVRKAFEAKDDAALAAAVKAAGPTTWSVADTLVAEGSADVALAVVAAYEDPSHDALLAYVEREKALPVDRAARLAVRAADEAFGRRDLAGALEALDGVVGRGLVGIHVQNGRALALAGLGRLEEASAAHVGAAQAATALGFHAAAARAYMQAASVATRRGDEIAARALQREVVAAARKAGDEARLAGALIDLASALDDADPDAAKASEEGIAIARRIGHRAFLANALVNLGGRRTRAGDLEGAKAALDEGLALQEAVGDVVYAARARSALGQLARRRGDFAEASRYLEEAAKAQEEAGDVGGACSSLELLVELAADMGDWARARTVAERSIALATQARLATHHATGLGALARAEASLGRPQAALDASDRAIELARATRVRRTIAKVLVSRAYVQLEVADYGPAEASAREAADLSASLGDEAGRILALTMLGSVLGRVGDGKGSLAVYQEVHAFYAARGLSLQLADAAGNVGFAYSSSGNAGEALVWALRARDLFLQLGDRRSAAAALQNVAAVYVRLGDSERARETLLLAMKEADASDDVAARAAALINLGSVLGTEDDPGAGVAALEEGLALARTSGARHWEINALSSLARTAHMQGDFGTARARWLEVLERTATMKVPRERACTFASLALLEVLRGDAKAALAAAESAVEHARASDDPWDRATGAAAMAMALVALGRHAEALQEVRAGTEALSASFVGVPTTLGVSSSTLWDALRASGLEAASALGDVSAVFDASERSRAGQVLEWLGGREAVGDAGVPPALAAEERARRTALLTAQARLARARATGEVAAVRAARGEVEAAEAAHLDAIGRIQLEARGAASVAFPEAPSLERLQASLPEGTAFVAYAVEEERSLALVATKDAARTVVLGAEAELGERIEPLLAALADGTSSGVEAAVATARKALVEPLALPADVKRVVVAPDGILAYVPFSALDPDRTVSFVASATAWRMLADGRPARGDGVLALGDPAYGGAAPKDAAARAAGGTGGDVALLPLPATRAEAKAVGTKVLLGAEATEKALVSALASKRWRAVHLACHGLVDEARPLRSSLALSSDAEGDGYLRVAEVYGMRIPTDLVVLSACESGRGRTYSGAGVVGFTGAFLLAGAPRVICSLWKVDDEATQALMTKFYELWNPRAGSAGAGTLSEPGAAPGESKGPGLPTAEALRQAQEHVKSQAKWTHPYYWAAWVLWGLPD